MGYVYLVLCVLFTEALYIIFREFKRHGVPLLPAVTVNYLVCVLVGVAVWPSLLPELAASAGYWPLSAVAQGLLFIFLFLLIGRASQEIGVAYATIITKVSLVIPVLVSFWVFKDAMPWLRWLGVALALGATVLINLRFLRAKGGRAEQLAPEAIAPQKALLWGVTLFIGTGLADSNFKVYDELFAGAISVQAFSVTIYAVAAVVGGLLLLVSKQQLTRKAVVGGVILGVPNFFSIYTLLQALAYLEGTVFYPVNNVALVLLASIVGWLAYRERFTRATLLGIVLAVASILLMVLAPLADA